MTLSKRRCLVSTRSGYHFIEALKDIEVVDSTGAGDAFVGGFASAMVQFRGDVEKAARYANVVAGLCVTRRGTAPSMPSTDAIQQRFNPVPNT